jgi:hypothetical protein
MKPQKTFYLLVTINSDRYTSLVYNFSYNTKATCDTYRRRFLEILRIDCKLQNVNFTHVPVNRRYNCLDSITVNGISVTVSSYRTDRGCTDVYVDSLLHLGFTGLLQETIKRCTA